MHLMFSFLVCCITCSAARNLVFPQLTSSSLSIDLTSGFESDDHLPAWPSCATDFLELPVRSASWATCADELGKEAVGRRLGDIHKQAIHVKRHRKELDSENALRMRWVFHMMRWLEDVHCMTKRGIAKESGKFVSLFSSCLMVNFGCSFYLFARYPL